MKPRTYRSREPKWKASMRVCQCCIFLSMFALPCLNWWWLLQEEQEQSKTGSKNLRHTSFLSGEHIPIQTAIAQSNSDAILKFLFDIPKTPPASGTTRPNCPLDRFLSIYDYHLNCHRHNGGDVCVFPGAILKRAKDPNKFKAELRAFKLLNDTRYFPELYYADEECQTFLFENVRVKGETANTWCANVTYYQDWYRNVFRIFTKKNIIPKDLNACCNTIVTGDHVRIIDFGLYQVKTNFTKVTETNAKMLSKLYDQAQFYVDRANKRRSLYCKAYDFKNWTGPNNFIPGG